MASTRLNNGPVAYCQQQRSLAKYRQHEMWKYKCVAPDTRFPCFGINMPMMTNGYNNGILSLNAADIESALLGIGETNLVHPKKPVTPLLNCVNGIDFFHKLPVFIPRPLRVEKCQRPQGPFC